MHVVTASEMYEIDRFTMEAIGLPGVVLMESAGRAAAEKAKQYIKKADKVAVLIGSGNNGGDGFVLARILLAEGYDADVWLIPSPEKLKGDAYLHFQIFQKSGYAYKQLQNYHVLKDYDVIVDAMLGIGVKGNLRSPYKDIIEFCNELEALKLSIDIPSGLPSNDNEEFSFAFKADITITLQCPKLSAYLFPHAYYYGKLEVVDIGIPPLAFENIANQRFLWQEADVRRTIAKRAKNSHKGTYGKCLIVGGSNSMTGAPIMAAKAAHRSGAGLVTLAVPESILPIVASHTLEATFSGWDDDNGTFSGQLGIDYHSFEAIAVGPGMGRNPNSSNIIRTLIQDFQGTLIIDADGLFHLQEHLDLLKERNAPTVLTPHSGEMARLMQISPQEVEQARFTLSYQFATFYRVHLALKGPYTIITCPEGTQYINTTGNPALAKGGSGDVLTGMIGAFVMNTNAIVHGVCNAAHFHGKAAELLTETEHSMIDVIASDVINVLPRVFRTAF